MSPGRRDQLIDAAFRALLLVLLGLTVLAMATLKVSA